MQRLQPRDGAEVWPFRGTRDGCDGGWCAVVQVPLYDTLGPDAITFILQQSQMHTVFAAKSEAQSVRQTIVLSGTTLMMVVRMAFALVPALPAQLVKVKRDFAEQTASLRNVVQFEDVSEADVKAAAAVGLTLRSFAELLERVRACRCVANACHVKTRVLWLCWWRLCLQGRAAPVPVRPPAPEDVHTFCYTSGEP